jgi:hypothetical protein
MPQSDASRAAASESTKVSNMTLGVPEAYKSEQDGTLKAERSPATSHDVLKWVLNGQKCFRSFHSARTKTSDARRQYQTRQSKSDRKEAKTSCKLSHGSEARRRTRYTANHESLLQNMPPECRSKVEDRILSNMITDAIERAKTGENRDTIRKSITETWNALHGQASENESNRWEARVIGESGSGSE